MIEQEIGHLHAKLETRRRLLDAAMLFIPTEGSSESEREPVVAPGRLGQSQLFTSEHPSADGAQMTPCPPDDKKEGVAPKVGWATEIMQVLNSAGRGLTHQAIIKEMMKSPFGDRLAESTKRYYTTVQRLIKRSEVEQRGKLYYSSYVLDQMIKRGEPIPEGADQPFDENDNTSPALIYRLISNSSNGLTGSQLVDELSMMPEATESILRHPQFVYNVLGSMVKKGLLVKEDRRYLAVARHATPPSSEPPSDGASKRRGAREGQSLKGSAYIKGSVH